jgi:hypothetical protein
MDQDRDEACLDRLGGRIDLDALVRADLGAERVDLFAIDTHPAVLDPFVGFAARAQAKLRHQFRQT